MSEKTREICTVVSQESIGAGIYSMWIQTDRIAADAKPGQFVSPVSYTHLTLPTILRV